ncbi:MAG TPA: DUF503 domain-containing protein [Syntrophorhabdales bacterium]|nr:DUF503 domain-containing protein [Syntrophorhabdales bacterium]
MVVGISRIEIFLPENHSLKEKRHAMTRIVERTKGKFNISIMEIDQTNLWQKATVGFAVVGVKQDHVSSTIDNVSRYIESMYIGEVIASKTEIMVIGDEV